MDPTLAIALILAIGLALSYRVKWKRAERQMMHMEATARYQRDRVDATERELGRLYEKLESTEAALTKAVAAEWPRGAA